MKRKNQKKYLEKEQLGATMVEAAIAVPVLLFTLFFLIDLCRYILVYTFLNTAAFSAADIFAKSVIEENTSVCDVDPEPCQRFSRYFQRAVQLGTDRAARVATSSGSGGAAELRPFRHFSSIGQQDDDLPSEPVDIVVLRPGERAERLTMSGEPTGEFVEHPTRSYAAVPEPGESGWPGAGESWEGVFAEQPVAAYLEVRFKTFTPFIPDLTVSAMRLAFRRAGQFVEGSPATPAGICGNGILESGESCDPPGSVYSIPFEGEEIILGVCRSDCLWCGIGGVQSPQNECGILGTEPFCDEGNCVPPWAVPGGDLGLACTCDLSLPGTCGNAQIDEGEACDASAFYSPPAFPQPGCFDCINCECTPSCGNGQLDPTLGEQCDAGQVRESLGGGLVGENPACDSCTTDCRCIPKCGNGQLDSGEQCDEGGSGTYASCDGVDPEAVCMDCLCPYCGNGVVDDKLGEKCDDGNDDDFDACNNDCEFNFCGDNIQNNGEQCDGSDLGDCETGQVCTDQCQCRDRFVCEDEICGYPGWEPTTDCRICTSECSCENPTECGDGELQPAFEQCEDAPGLSCLDLQGVDVPCTSDCQCLFCGDGTVTPPEACDPAAAASCPTGRTCRSDCGRCMRCRDGVLDPELGEECDDGNSNDFDSCGNDCRFNFCGDGTKNNGEQCDGSSGVGGSCAACRSDCTCVRCGDPDFVPAPPPVGCTFDSECGAGTCIECACSDCPPECIDQGGALPLLCGLGRPEVCPLCQVCSNCNCGGQGGG